MGTPTTNLALTKPTVGADNNAWGTELNGDLDIIDGLFPSGALAIAHGGTGGATAAAAKTALGIDAPTLIASGTISSAAAGIVITSVPSTYNRISFKAISLEPSVDGDSLTMRIGNQGTGLPRSGATDYQYTTQGSGSGSASPITGLFSTVAGSNLIAISGPITNVVNAGSLLDLEITSDASNMHVSWTITYRKPSTFELTRMEGAGVLQGFSGPVTDFQFIFSSGGSTNMKRAKWSCNGRTLG